MVEISEEKIANLLERSGIKSASAKLNIGRELSYKDGFTRLVVIHFNEPDMPEVLTSTIQKILPIEDRWYLMRRFGSFSALAFASSEFQNLIEKLIGHVPHMLRENDDMYLIGDSGKIIMEFDHHIFDEGLDIFVSDVSIASHLLRLLNEHGAEIELYSRHD